ncbi:MAG: DUF3368 domain-containing protein [Nitrospinae bacterium]|nr:DUF3368 domain-containing protein [Nitrospinota bacterium]
MLLVADSSSLISLSTCQALPILKELFNEIKVPESVFIEVTQGGKKQSRELSGFLAGLVVSVDEPIARKFSFGRGELEAMALYARLNANRLLVDDKKARKIAVENGMNIIGSLGVLLIAKEKGIIKSVSPYLHRLSRSDLYIKAELLNHIMNLANE